jgi:H+/Cl- antiporter ClcA
LGSGAIVLGVFGGLLGPFFIFTNTQVNALRLKVLNTKWRKVIETPIICFITASVFYFIPMMLGVCIKENKLEDKEYEYYTKAWCS